MSSDNETCSSSSSSSSYERKHKLKKKQKKKSKKHKKEKKSSKEKKLKKGAESTKEKEFMKIQPIAPPRHLDTSTTTCEADSFGPALPPHLANKTDNENPIVIGPVLPKNICLDTDKIMYTNKLTQNESTNEEEQEEILDGTYGPIPANTDQEISAAQIELEKRALELKMAALDGLLPSSSNDQTVREEWMLELPDVGMKGGLAALNNLKRGFYQGKERPDFSDRSSWTKTPQSTENERTKPTTSKESLKAHAQALYDKQRDDEQERMAKKYKKKHKREESLVDIHQKKLRKEEKRKAKELKESGSKPERRPFSRDIDLKLNKIDKNQTKQIVDKARLLDTKFSSGHTKYL
ncbi:GPALPP motifs-containing protein 1 [Musca domestica]|uniref:GPALPP motifs-containing protein 1 n=1 Tax=Musca domestica TaxID=7370 RepID=A0A9J7IAD2_MUSDO|nr:GPALPP motifs-containing protein 1 [Musca domestica]XP_011294989.2 GPALPP motifs-containing protein 1 [Musca domestica]